MNSGRTRRQIERARAIHSTLAADREAAEHRRRKDKHVPKTKDGIRRAALKLDALDTEIDAAYSTASEALDLVQTARERATSGSTADRSRFPAIDQPPRQGKRS